MEAAKVPVDAKTYQTFATLFLIGRGRKGPLAWDDFVKAMTKVGFAYGPRKTGAGMEFVPVTVDVEGTFVWHKPHGQRKGRASLDRKGKRLIVAALNEMYQWDRDTFVLQH
ncbi:hypothetical protein OH77DRAFT_1000274 [Trametes cingulata]|nr:hypothetical protein OH77DRAFT_1000274 [Trametes cingulata]